MSIRGKIDNAVSYLDGLDKEEKVLNTAIKMARTQHRRRHPNIIELSKEILVK